MLNRMANREYLEAPPVERVGRICHLDHFGIGRRRVLEGGIMLLTRSIRWIMLSCERCFVSGCVTG